MKKVVVFLFLCFFVFLFFRSNAYSQEVTILYTGQTHAMLYPCSCPIQQDGGIARRVSLVKELRKKHPALLLLDCGSFTAGGIMDEYAQNAPMDMRRTEVNLKAMGLAKYDAVAIGPDEFNFGKEFFLKNAASASFAFLSANLGADKVVPFTVKDAGGVKLGLIGLTGLAANQKAEGLKINEPKEIEGTVSRLKKEGAQVIILLSTLGEKEDLRLISGVKGIDLVFVGQAPLSNEPLTEIDGVFFLRPSWQGRKLGKLTLEIKDGRLKNCKIDELRLSNEIVDDPGIKAVLPRCYADANCKKEGSVGSCQDPGELNADCIFTEPNKIKLTVISVKDCVVCNEEPVIKLLKNKFPGVIEQFIYYPDPVAQKLIKDLSILGLPAYILGKEVEKEDNFNAVKDDFRLIGDVYLFKPQVSGIAYFFDRAEEKGNLDLFLNLFEKDTPLLLETMEEFKPRLHFLAQEKTEGFEAKNGAAEVEEYLRGVCVQEYYPQKFWNYLTCRSKNNNSAYWEDCLGGSDAGAVKSCARGPQGVKLLQENISLNKELKVSTGPSYLLDNHEIFSSRGVPKKEEFRKIIKKR